MSYAAVFARFIESSAACKPPSRPSHRLIVDSLSIDLPVATPIAPIVSSSAAMVLRRGAAASDPHLKQPVRQRRGGHRVAVDEPQPEDGVAQPGVPPDAGQV